MIWCNFANAKPFRNMRNHEKKRCLPWQTTWWTCQSLPICTIWKCENLQQKWSRKGKTLRKLSNFGVPRRTDGIFSQELPRYRLGDTTDKCKSETPVWVQHVQQPTQEWGTNLVSTGQTGICWNEISPPSSEIFLIDAHLSAAFSRLKTLKSKYSPRMLVAWSLLMLLDLRLEKTPPKTQTLLELEGFAAEGYFASLKCVCPEMFGMNWDDREIWGTDKF